MKVRAVSPSDSTGESCLRSNGDRRMNVPFGFAMAWCVPRAGGRGAHLTLSLLFSVGIHAALMGKMSIAEESGYRATGLRGYLIAQHVKPVPAVQSEIGAVPDIEPAYIEKKSSGLIPASSAARPSDIEDLKVERAEQHVDPVPAGPYYEDWETDIGPKILNAVDIPVPNIALGSADPSLKLTLKIGFDGKVDDVVVGQSSLPIEFQEAASSSLRQALFAPALRDGVAVKSQLVIEVVFAPGEQDS